MRIIASVPAWLQDERHEGLDDKTKYRFCFFYRFLDDDGLLRANKTFEDRMCKLFRITHTAVKDLVITLENKGVITKVAVEKSDGKLVVKYELLPLRRVIAGIQKELEENSFKLVPPRWKYRYSILLANADDDGYLRLTDELIEEVAEELGVARRILFSMLKKFQQAGFVDYVGESPYLGEARRIYRIKTCEEMLEERHG